MSIRQFSKRVEAQMTVTLANIPLQSMPVRIIDDASVCENRYSTRLDDRPISLQSL